MYCKRVSVMSFRNICEAEVDFSQGVNVLVGENAQGKTNLLEAVFYASVGRSVRAANVGEMIRFGDKSAEISVDYQRDERERCDNVSIKLFTDKKKIVEKNHLKVDKLSDIVGSFRAVLFCPEHLSLIKDGPSERRSYLDIAISRISPKYIHSLQRYTYFLKQRNALIKEAYNNRAAFDATVELWSEKMAEEATVISEQRYLFVKRVSALVEGHFERMTGSRERTDMVYHGNAGLSAEEYLDREKVKSRYMSLLSSSHDREIAMGSTLYGIHKDDADIKINGKSARSFASQGQQRSLALAMKLAEGEICREEFGDYPVFLFDDVLSELDETRRDYLLLNATDKQIIISTCEEDFAMRMNAEKRIRVSEGTYVEIE